MYEGENFIYCLCELYRGADLLNSIIKKGSQPESKALNIILQIMEALAYMHSKQIIHRDLKPENIIFKGTQENIDIGIVDLGFATFEEDYRKLFVRCGTPGYVAPEVLNDKDYTCKADVFSAGIIFYIMFVNKPDRDYSIQWNLIQADRSEEHEGSGELRLLEV
jgi:calcium/calmodulin-dependent protein kinase I